MKNRSKRPPRPPRAPKVTPRPIFYLFLVNFGSILGAILGLKAEKIDLKIDLNLEIIFHEFLIDF